MATDTAELETRKYSAPDPRQNAWQIPLSWSGGCFCLGLAGLAPAGHARPLRRLHARSGRAAKCLRESLARPRGAQGAPEQGRRQC